MKKLYFILAPFAIIYGGIVALRNLLFDLKILPNIIPQIPSIGIGNLNVGGTGKSVLVDYLITYFKQKKTPLVISRGYKRKTRGVIIANDKSSASTIGDEPYQFFSKHKIGVIVCEKRKDGLNILMQKNLKPDVIIFDDLMQHRYVNPHCLVTTTSFDQGITLLSFLGSLDPKNRIFPKHRFSGFRRGIGNPAPNSYPLLRGL